MRKPNKDAYRTFNLYTIIAVLLLIGVGSVVRVMEAGMGCPDWPKCFGGYIPPTCAEQLPDDYQELFLQKRLAKNERLAGVLNGMGMSNLAQRLTSDPDIRVEEEYSGLKAWVEYINRLIGVVIGLFIIMYCWYALRYQRSQSKVVIYSFLGLVLVLFQGWIGSLVVSTNLLPGFVSVHMGLAFLLIGILIYTYHLTATPAPGFVEEYGRISLILFLLLLPQLFLGTQVREQVDALLFRGIMREDLIGQMSVTFYIHRTSSLLILGLAAYGVYRLYNDGHLSSNFGRIWMASLALIVLEVLGGAAMAYFAIPKVIQPLHLLSSAVLFGLLYYLTLRASSVRRGAMVTV